jgi:ribosomal protein S20
MKNCYSKLLKEEKKEEASLYLRSLESFISKLKNKGILHRKTAQRSISRSALKLNRSN